MAGKKRKPEYVRAKKTGKDRAAWKKGGLRVNRDDCCDEVERMSNYLADLSDKVFLMWDKIWGQGGGGDPPPPPRWP